MTGTGARAGAGGRKSRLGLSREVRRRIVVVWILAVGLAIIIAGINIWARGTSDHASAAGKAITVGVTLSDFKIAATQTTFLVGTTYHFVVTNKGEVSHEFMLIPPEDDIPPVQTTDQLYNYARAHIPEVKPGTTEMIDYTFQPSDKVPLEMACYYPGEHDAGMLLSVTVL